MHGGYIENRDYISICECGNKPVLVWHYIGGIANRIHYFIKCENCKQRTRDRRKATMAILDWNVGFKKTE